MECQACVKAGGRYNYLCQECCVRLMKAIPFLEVRRALMDSIAKANRLNKSNEEAEEFVSALKKRLILEWQQRKRAMTHEREAVTP